MSRKAARELVFTMVFELCFHKPEDSTTYEEFLKENQLSEENKAFVQEIYTGVVNHFDELTEQISKHIKGYTLDRLFKVDLAILLLSFYEILYYSSTPQTVVANEAVELAKKFSTDKSYGFINAVIASFINSLQQ